MAKIQTIHKSRKLQKCGKCGKEIPVGSTYLKAEPYMRRPMIRCTSCGLKAYETSGSAFVQAAGRLCEEWSNDYTIDEDGLSSIMTEVESLKDECEYSLDNMPYQLQESDSGLILQDRIDMLDSVYCELENIDVESVKSEVVDEFDFEEFMPNFGTDSDNNFDALRDSRYDDIVDMDSVADEVKSEMEQLFIDKLSDLIESALAELTY